MKFFLASVVLVFSLAMSGCTVAQLVFDDIDMSLTKAYVCAGAEPRPYECQSPQERAKRDVELQTRLNAETRTAQPKPSAGIAVSCSELIKHRVWMQFPDGTRSVSFDNVAAVQKEGAVFVGDGAAPADYLEWGLVCDGVK